MVEILAYSPEWPKAFADLKKVLERHLGSLALGIEHVGSTSVPGLAAKPIIDLDIIIASADRLPEVASRLAGLGYFHQGNKGIPGREAFGQINEDVPRDGSGQRRPAHHLYICARDSAELARHLAFRDVLRAKGELAIEYAALKRRLAGEHGEDREAYCLGKSEFVERALRLATSGTAVLGYTPRAKPEGVKEGSGGTHAEFG